MRDLKLVFVLALIFCTTLSLFSQTGSISGCILDQKTGRSIPDANIIIENSGHGVASGDGGFYVFKNVPVGKQTLIVSVMGYRKAKVDVTISGSSKQDILLEPAEVWVDPVMVTATRTDHRQSQITVSTDILTPERMSEQTGATAGELIASSGGLLATAYDHFAGVSMPSLRGAGTDRVLVLMDDIPINSAQGGGVDLNTIPVDALEKIEVVRGGHSALYGADAVGGVIHLISKEAAPQGISFGVGSTVGSFGLYSATLHAGQRLRSLSWFAQYNETQSDGDFKFKIPTADSSATRQNNDCTAHNLFLKSTYTVSDCHHIQALYQRLDTRRGVAGQITYLSPAARRHETRDLFSVQSENQWTDQLRLRQKLFWETYDNHYTNPESWIPEDDLHQNTALGADLQAQYQVAQSLALIAGAEIRRNKLESTSISDQNRTAIASFGQLEITRPLLLGMVLKLVPAIRYDHFSDVSSHTSPRFGLLLSSGKKETFALRANVGYAFRVPSFNDLYWPEDAYTKGNPDLKPETARTLDIGFTFREPHTDWLQFESTFFRNRFKDLIQWEAGDDWIWAPRNVGDAEITGLENALNCRWPGDRLYFKITYTWMKALDKTAGSLSLDKDLIYRPRDKWDFSAGAKWRAFYLNLNFRFVGARYADAANTNKLDGFSSLNGNIGRDLKFRQLTLALRLEGINLTDQSIYMTEGYPSPGREIRFSVGIKH